MKGGAHNLYSDPKVQLHNSNEIKARPRARLGQAEARAATNITMEDFTDLNVSEESDLLLNESEDQCLENTHSENLRQPRFTARSAGTHLIVCMYSDFNWMYIYTHVSVTGRRVQLWIQNSWIVKELIKQIKLAVPVVWIYTPQRLKCSTTQFTQDTLTFLSEIWTQNDCVLHRCAANMCTANYAAEEVQLTGQSRIQINEQS